MHNLYKEECLFAHMHECKCSLYSCIYFN